MRKARGVFLIYILFITLLITMYVGAAMALGPGGLFRARGAGEQLAAREAAQSGLDYALTRLRRDPLWKGNGTGIVVRRDDLVVAEDNGNVVGLVRAAEGGEFAQFRLRFNYQDGGAGPDELNDPAPAMLFEFPGISLNNLSDGSDSSVPVADGPGAAVPANPSTYRRTPARSVWLAVEGRAGAGLHGLSETNLNPPLAGGASAVVVEVCALIGPGTSSTTPDAVLMAADGLEARLPDGSGAMDLSSAAATTIARIRSAAGLRVTGGAASNLVSADAEAHYMGDSSAFSANTQNVAAIADSEPAPFYQLGWTNVRQAQGSRVMKAGTYVVWQDGTVHYYDMPLADYKTWIKDHPSDQGSTPNLPAGMSLQSLGTTPPTYKMVVTDDVTVEPSLTNKLDLAIVPRAGAPEGPYTGGLDVDQYNSKFLTAAPDQFYTNIAPGVMMIHGSNPAQTGHADQLGSIVAQALTWENPGLTTGPGGMLVHSQGGVELRVNAGNHGLTIYASNWQAAAMRMRALTMDWAQNTGNMSNTDLMAVAQALGCAGGSGPGTLPNPTNDGLQPADLTLEFAPTNAQSFAVLSAPGNVHLGTSLVGTGGSITARGDLKVVGLGVDLAANPNAQEGVSLYAQGDLTINTFAANTAPVSNAPVAGSYRDISLKGVVYTWKNFKAIAGDHLGTATSAWGKFSLEGCMVAYGGDPSSQSPGEGEGGKMDFLGADIRLRFDPNYLQNIRNSFPANPVFLRVAWNQR